MIFGPMIFFKSIWETIELLRMTSRGEITEIPFLIISSFNVIKSLREGYLVIFLLFVNILKVLWSHMSILKIMDLEHHHARVSMDHYVSISLDTLCLVEFINAKI